MSFRGMQATGARVLGGGRRELTSGSGLAPFRARWSYFHG